jgi:hypothetical protein
VKKIAENLVGNFNKPQSKLVFTGVEVVEFSRAETAWEFSGDPNFECFHANFIEIQKAFKNNLKVTSIFFWFSS